VVAGARAVTADRIRIDDGQHPAVKDPKVYLTCACCVRRELLPVLMALDRGRHGKARLMLANFWLELDAQIEAAVAADQGKLQ
jgi:hypothetical protein